MTPDMSVNDMLDSFIFITKGSRVIDRKATDWGRYLWLEEKYVKHRTHTVAELKRYFAQSKYNRFGSWTAHPKRLNAPTLADAVRFAVEIARGDYESQIDVDAMIHDQNPSLWWAMRSRHVR